MGERLITIQVTVSQKNKSEGTGVDQFTIDPSALPDLGDEFMGKFIKNMIDQALKDYEQKNEKEQ